MAPAVEAQLDAAVDQPLAEQPLAHPALDEEVDGALLEHPGAHPPLDVLAAARLEDDGLDAVEVEQVGEHQPRRARADDRHLGSHPRPQPPAIASSFVTVFQLRAVTPTPRRRSLSTLGS